MERWQTELVENGCSDKTRKSAIAVLRSALNHAVKSRIIDFNPITVLTIPKADTKNVIPLEIEQCQKLIESAESHRVGEIVTFALFTGLRIGECLAVEWRDLNLHECMLFLRRKVTETSEGQKAESVKGRNARPIPLDERVVEALYTRRKKAIDEGLDPDECPIVFPTLESTWYYQGNFNRTVWYPIRDAAGIPDRYTFHDLRHQQAALMIAAGAHMKVVQQRLGHKSFQVTADTYSHLLADAETDAVNDVNKLFTEHAVGV